MTASTSTAKRRRRSCKEGKIKVDKPKKKVEEPVEEAPAEEASAEEGAEEKAE